MAGVRKRPAAASASSSQQVRLGRRVADKRTAENRLLPKLSSASTKRGTPAPQLQRKRRRKSDDNQEVTEKCEPLAKPCSPLAKLEAALTSLRGPGRPSDLPAYYTKCCHLVTEALHEKPFGILAEDCDWSFKRALYLLLDRLMQLIESGLARDAELDAAFTKLIHQLVHAGYASRVKDRQYLVMKGWWRPLVDLLRRRSCSQNHDDRIRAMRAYMYMADCQTSVWHRRFSTAEGALIKDFWDPSTFIMVLRELTVAPWFAAGNVDTPYGAETLLEGQWEMFAADIEASLKVLASFLVRLPRSFWSKGLSREVTQCVESYMENVLRLLPVVNRLARCDNSHGRLLECCGGPLEGLIKVSGLIIGRLSCEFEEPELYKDNKKSRDATARFMSRFLQEMLCLNIPTCCHHRHDGQAEAGNDLVPIDERQQDAEWLEILVDNVGIDKVLDCNLMSHLFQAMVRMPLEEQRYRLDCISPLVSPFIAFYAQQLHQNIVPPELTNLKTVINAVLQDQSVNTSDLHEEVCFYPCLLEFATKRAGIQAACERSRLNSSSDPIRLVVPRDNVLDGVCPSLHLGDGLTPARRIDVPLEIEFRSGYADDNGSELVDEGEDQGGLRRQWLDRASRYFIQSDLFMSPSLDAAHLEGDRASASNSSSKANRRAARGLIFVPSPESVCRCVQDDWKEQFELFGCILGFAIQYKETIPVHLGHNFLRSVFGVKTDAQEALLLLLETIDKTLHTKLKYILDGSYVTLGDTLQDVLEQCHLPRNFTFSESHCPELVSSTPLKENGEHILVTEDNKQEFVSLLLEQILVSGIATQVQCFRRGLHRVIPEEIVQRMAELMTIKEIELMVCGADEIDVADWQKHTQYENGYTAQSQPIRWFWEVVRGFSAQSRADLLAFATGSAQVPSGGFRFLQPELFTVQRVPVTDRFPEAHTCANMVDLPEYSSREELERRLRFAIEETGDVFGRR